MTQVKHRYAWIPKRIDGKLIWLRDYWAVQSPNQHHNKYVYEYHLEPKFSWNTEFRIQEVENIDFKYYVIEERLITLNFGYISEIGQWSTWFWEIDLDLTITSELRTEMARQNQSHEYLTLEQARALLADKTAQMALKAEQRAQERQLAQRRRILRTSEVERVIVGI